MPVVRSHRPLSTRPNVQLQRDAVPLNQRVPFGEFEGSELDSALLCFIRNGRKLYMARKDMEKLMQLRSMGFQDDERSINLLREHSGDLTRVVNRLMTSTS